MRLCDNITCIKGIGEKSAKLFQKLNIETVGDLLYHIPKDYTRFENGKTVRELLAENIGKGAFLGTVAKEGTVRRVGHLSILNLIVKDEEGVSVKVSFFNMPYLKKTLMPGVKYVFYGTLYEKGTLICMDHPKLYKISEYAKLLGVLQPVYSLTKGLSNDTIGKYVKIALEELEEVPEYLPPELIKKHNFISQNKMLQNLHLPQSLDVMVEARKRLVYEEFFFFILAMKYRKNFETDIKRGITFLQTPFTEKLISSLPYELTSSQQKVWAELVSDFEGEKSVNRLIQGDVGSGKTIIAILCLLLCAVNGYQGALMAPTEVLATQHFETITEMIAKYELPMKPVLLVGSMTVKAKREAYAGIENGDYNVIIGTHALIQEKLNFHNLALAITDEQHRFGVKQRETLATKASNYRVHTIVMSATPIPRSLAIILYGDLDVSTIPELPANRLPIKNCVIGKNNRQSAYHFMKQEIAKGHQVYVICPMVESGIMDELENVVDYSTTLKEQMPPEIKIAYLHGKMKPAEKNRIMTEFAEKQIDILVSTTVIEVGINVPNATVMMVENADRFGLAALHQIRGRVGRGSSQSYCIFIDTKESKTSKERLNILNHSNDGFFIANEDLRLRGPGDLTGTIQSGEFSFQFADIYKDADMLMAAGEDINELIKIDPLLNCESHIPCKEKCLTYFEEEYINVI